MISKKGYLFSNSCYTPNLQIDVFGKNGYHISNLCIVYPLILL